MNKYHDIFSKYKIKILWNKIYYIDFTEKKKKF